MYINNTFMLGLLETKPEHKTKNRPTPENANFATCRNLAFNLLSQRRSY